MKKIIYAALLVIGASLFVTACTEEEVKPQTEFNASGGAGSDTKI
jgi:hypothetical protein